MGLGKTLQSIALLYTLLRQGFDGEPMAKKAIIVTPTSLVSNWESEIKKWVGDRLQLIALCESTRDDVVSGLDSFIRPHSPYQVLIVSYETFRMHSSKFDKSGSCDRTVQTLTNRMVVLSSGISWSFMQPTHIIVRTPDAEYLEEFFAMVNFTNPGILGDAAYFRRYYELPIISGREPTSTEEERNLSVERSAELSTKVNQFILRRTNALLSNHLPPKVKRAISEEAKQSKFLAYITALKKLCNHPKLIYNTIKSGSGTSGFEDCICFFPPAMFFGRCGAWTGGDGVWVELSGKMHVLARLLAQLRSKTDDRIVLVSNYTRIKDAYVLKFFEDGLSRLPTWCNNGDNVKLPSCQIKCKYRMELPEYNTMEPYPHMNERCASLPPKYYRSAKCCDIFFTVFGIVCIHSCMYALNS
ncbi:hypothetical protein C5167_009334 [Papaver somniferum]|uniref:SNF2 N-terminal domain-containing protein n=1 Tax=Papaver somniferum TaxID=3469 RepID=A0A4Y7JYH4_PAPSO|nr:hypothetical protein C5167_009334 [Papaver somniferum]